MKNLISKILQFLSFRLIGRNTTKQGLLKLFNAFDLNVLEVAHNEMGINKYGSIIETGEDFFLRNYLFDKFNNKSINTFSNTRRAARI